MWSALAAARLLDIAGKSGEVEVVVVAPRPELVLRPRLYEEAASTMVAPLQDLFDATGIRYVRGSVAAIVPSEHRVEIADEAAGRVSLSYDSLVLATGSRLFQPDIPGLRAHAFSVDQLEDAVRLETHCHRLAALPDTPARNTAVVAGGGFTGIEIAAELPARLRKILGDRTSVRVVIVEQAPDIGPELGPGPRPVINEALSALGVEYRLGTSVAAIDANGVTTSSGERIAAQTVVWTAGMRASPLTGTIPGVRDPLGRLHVDRHLRVPQTTNVFAAGDTAFAATDDEGHHALMSCQHALRLGRSAGHNAAALLLGVPVKPYRQPVYVTGLDLGPWGAVHTTGWERKVVLTGAESKARKRYVNGVVIYPPRADRAEAFAAADPDQNIVSPRKPADKPLESAG